MYVTSLCFCQFTEREGSIHSKSIKNRANVPSSVSKNLKTLFFALAERKTTHNQFVFNRLRKKNRFSKLHANKSVFALYCRHSRAKFPSFPSYFAPLSPYFSP